MILKYNMINYYYEYLIYKFTKNRNYLKSYIYVDNLFNLVLTQSNIFSEEDKNSILSFYYYVKYHKFYPPSVLHLCITDFCQLHCKHCYFGAEQRLKSMTYDEVQLYIKKFKEFHNIFVNDYGYKLPDNLYNKFKPAMNISGGEPLLHKDLVKIIKSIPNDFIKRISILTNGYDYNLDVVSALNNQVESPLYQISLDGTETTHNFIRGNDSFNHTINTIQQIKKYYPETFILISYNFHQSNYKELVEVTRIAKEAGANKITFNRYIPYWDSGLKVCTKEQYVEILKLMDEAYKKYNDDTFIVYRMKSMQKYKSYICMACVRNQTIVSSGDRYICSRYHIKNGNYLTDDIQTLVKNALIKDIETLRIPPDCFNCKDMQDCQGGMRCLTYACGKNNLDKDIHCNE